MRKKIRCIGVIGLGLIGGSLAMALKEKGYKVTGITNDKSFRLGQLQNTDLIFICTPLNLINSYIKKITKIVKHPLILTDVGSTKSEICKYAQKILPANITFIGGHPMAGSEKSGIKWADKALFQNCAWVLTPINKNSKQEIKTLQKIIKQIGAKILITTPDEHDRAVALISHLPLLASIGLCEVVRNIKDPKLRRLAKAIASSGFRDTTRIGAGNPELSLNLLRSNSKNLSKLIPIYLKELNYIFRLANKKPKTLNNLLNQIMKQRKTMFDTKGYNKYLSASH